MAKIQRYLHTKILQDLQKKKIIVIFGARQVGKTTLVKEFLHLYKNSIYINGDFLDDQQKLSEPTRAMVDQFKNYQLLVIDEAQRIPDIGLKLKVIFDTLPDLSVIATGSSAFEIANKVNEPLTGRVLAQTMYPISLSEAVSAQALNIDQLLVYGAYPEVVTATDEHRKREIIEHISVNYLFKDVLNIEYIQNPRSLEYLLKALADQLGSEVSVNELSNKLSIDTKTIAKYLDILEKLHIIFPLHPFATNVRKSITKKRKYYFFDLGIRNAIIGNFTAVSARSDIGVLWENFCVIERIKQNEEKNRFVKYYFWRSYQGDEIDLLEIDNQFIRGFECKWNGSDLTNKIKKIYKEDLKGLGEITIFSKNTALDLLKDV